ncbi:MAG TPA: ComEA family DNA-binding protein [Acidimicrobiia bacterium]|nr:ComEA family DNA-binding protein [Acidimicrobiia bacterium]
MGEIRGRVPVLVGLAVLGLAVGGLMGRSGSPTPPTSSPVTTEPVAHESPHVTETLTVHVSGMVMSPGVVDVPPGAIVADVIEAAGGLRPTALVDRINLAATVSAGDQIVVPGPEGMHDASAPGSDGSGRVVALNTASVSDLESLPGVGPVLAERIVSFREHNGPFDVIEDLLEVPGIGEAKLAALRDLVRP